MPLGLEGVSERTRDCLYEVGGVEAGENYGDGEDGLKERGDEFDFWHFKVYNYNPISIYGVNDANSHKYNNHLNSFSIYSGTKKYIQLSVNIPNSQGFIVHLNIPTNIHIFYREIHLNSLHLAVIYVEYYHIVVPQAYQKGLIFIGFA